MHEDGAAGSAVGVEHFQGAAGEEIFSRFDLVEDDAFQDSDIIF
ncbi:hypothetical protein ACFL02_04115 [Planctomycetota bacterium]